MRVEFMRGHLSHAQIALFFSQQGIVFSALAVSDNGNFVATGTMMEVGVIIAGFLEAKLLNNSLCHSLTHSLPPSRYFVEFNYNRH